MLDKLLAAGAYTIGDNVDFRKPNGYCVNLGKVDANFNVTINPLMQDLVDELLDPRAPVTADPLEDAPVPAPRKTRKPKAVEPKVDTTEAMLDDEPSLGSLADD